MKNVVLYHDNCFDGMASAWAAWKKLGDNATYRGVTYGPKDINDMMQDCYENANINDNLYILDFSFPRDVLLALHDKVNKLVVLDHHKTAQKDLEGLDFCIFDMEKSGARLAWEYFHYPHHGQEGTHLGFTNADYHDSSLGLNPFYIPKLIQYIEDRDLWRFALPNSHEVNAFIQSFPMEIKQYDKIHGMLENDLDFCYHQGEAIERYKETMIEAQCKNHWLEQIGEFLVPCVNSTILFSEVGNRLCQMYPTYPFAMYYTEKIANGKKMKQYGLRSIGDFDVSEVAKKYGGGGHKNAAGFIKE